MLGKKKISGGKENNQTGLSANGSLSGGRFFNKDGSANISYSGLPFFEKIQLYHSLLSLTNLQFMGFIILFFVAVNLFFAGLYLLIGLDHLGGMVANTAGEKFGEAFFFSAQTFTTVGYGRINPFGFWASMVASVEALAGLMSFALLTGLLYGRFSRPRAFVKFSHAALIAPYQEGNAWMCRLATHTKNIIMNAEARVTLAIQMEEQGVLKNKFFSLPLEIPKINVLSGSWTLVHAIREESPLKGLSAADLEAGKAEILVFLQGFDEAFSNTVVARSSYTWRELVFGARFVPMFHPNGEGNTTLIQIDLLSKYETL